MLDVIKAWYRRVFNDADAIILFLFILSILAIFLLLGDILKPVIASVVVAYLMSGLIEKMERFKIPHGLTVLIVYIAFFSAVIIAILGIFPPLWRQTTNFFQELPNMITGAQKFLDRLPQKYPDYITSQQISHVTTQFKSILSNVGQAVLSFSIASIPTLIAFVLYFVLVPFLVYFFLMDKQQIVNWLSQYLPENRRLITQVWQEVDEQFGNYIRGRFLEIFLIAMASYIAFVWLGLEYAMLLAVSAGFSVIVPYIGAVVVTIPIFLIGIFQWGWSANFAYLVVLHSLITLLGGYIIEPLLFSEAVNLHPVAIIVAVLFFGGLWGFWGIFFAIPLATVVNAVLKAWPRMTNNS